MDNPAWIELTARMNAALDGTAAGFIERWRRMADDPDAMRSPCGRC